MTNKQAFEFIAKHSGVMPDPLKLETHKPTVYQLDQVKKQLIAKVNQAIALVKKHHGIKE